jgi:chromate transporter
MGTPPAAYTGQSPQQHLAEVALLFLKLGCTAFGGPAAHIATMRHEVVQRRKWLDDQRFLDLLGATNLIPGPNSTEMTIHLGYLRAGWPGLIVGGTCFILPAMLMVMALAWVYVRLGATPQASWLLYGVKPVIIAIIVQALVGLMRQAIKGPLTAIVGLVTLVLSLLGVNVIALLFVGGATVMLVQNLRRLQSPGMASVVLPFLGLSPALLTSTVFSLPLLFLTFLKIGAVLYGSGYVLLAFLRADFVTRLGWLTDQQLLDAVAIGQVTPGPVFTTATFIGFVLGGVSGALWATLGIFLPGFIFVAFSYPLIPRIRHSPWTSGLLDGVNITALGLMAAVTWQLGRASLVDPLTGALALLSLALLLKYKLNATWLVLGGAVVGLLRAALS